MRELHFLERGVERMDRPELEFALQLYQDRPLLTAVLAGIHPPEGIERIALGLAEGGQGPWIVVTRQGDLVTCLAKGMNPTGLHVVSMGKVAQLVADVMRQRERLAWVAEKAPKTRQDQLITQLFQAGLDLSREAFCVHAAFQPLNARSVRYMVAKWYEHLHEVRMTAPRLMERPARAIQDVVVTYQRVVWGTSAALPLLALEGRDHTWVGEEMVTLWPVSMLLDGLLAPALRGIWSLGRVGKALLPQLKREMREARFAMQYLTAAASLLVTGLRYRSTRAEVRKVLTAQTPQPLWDAWTVEMHRNVQATYEYLLDFPEDGLKTFGELSQQHALSLCQKAGGALAAQYPTAESIPLDLAQPAATMRPGDIMKEGVLITALFRSAPWLAQCEAEDLFLPEAFLRAARLHNSPEVALAMVRRFVDKKQPVRAEKKPGRNEPCTCGSGKKFKACCARMAA